MEKLDLFQKMLIEQKEGLAKLIETAKQDRSMAGLTVTVVLESEERMVKNFILLADILTDMK